MLLSAFSCSRDSVDEGKKLKKKTQAIFSYCAAVCVVWKYKWNVLNLIASQIRSSAVLRAVPGTLKTCGNIERSNTIKRSLRNRFTGRCFQPFRRLLHARWKSQNFYSGISRFVVLKAWRQMKYTKFFFSINFIFWFSWVSCVFEK